MDAFTMWEERMETEKKQADANRQHIEFDELKKPAKTVSQDVYESYTPMTEQNRKDCLQD